MINLILLLWDYLNSFITNSWQFPFIEKREGGFRIIADNSLDIVTSIIVPAS